MGSWLGAFCPEARQHFVGPRWVPGHYELTANYQLDDSQRNALHTRPRDLEIRHRPAGKQAAARLRHPPRPPRRTIDPRATKRRIRTIKGISTDS